MAIFSGLLNVLIVVCSLFMICLVLIQRGRGGGLAGAFGGAGGSSAFGTKAGDVFTRITIITAGIWFLMAMILVFINNQAPVSAGAGLSGGDSGRTVPVTTAGSQPPAAGTAAGKTANTVQPRTPEQPATGSGPVAPAPDLPVPAPGGAPSVLPPALEDEAPAKAPEPAKAP